MKTYQELLNYLLTLNNQQLKQTCTVMLTGILETFAINDFDVSTEHNDIVDPGSILLLVHDGNTSGKW